LSADWIVAGLGNPGRRYEGTRHDAGFALAGWLAREARVSWRREDDLELAGPFRAAGVSVLLARPQAYMNRSGPPLRRLLATESVPVERLLVACDDVNLPLGRVRLRPSGSGGGHNGLASVIAEVGEGFGRIRLGVGAPPPETDLADWVLAPMAPEDLETVQDMLRRAAALVRDCWERGRIEPRTSDAAPEPAAAADETSARKPA